MPRKKDSPIKCLYHQIKPKVPCPDGIAAAWVVQKKYPKAQLIGCIHQDEPPQVNDGDLLIIVDFSFPIDVIKSWESRNCKIILIDHHKTLLDRLCQQAKETLTPLLTDYINFPDPFFATDSEILNSFLQFSRFTNFHRESRSVLLTKLDGYIQHFCDAIGVKQLSKFFTKSDTSFDITKCGAVLTWEYFFPDVPVPAFLYLIQDRDLWQWKLPNSRELNTAFSYIGRDMKDMDLWSQLTLEQLDYYYYDLGNMLYSPRVKKAKKLAQKSHWVECWNYKFLAVGLTNIEAPFYGDVLEYLYTNNSDSKFVCSYTKTDNNKYKLSFRSPQIYDGFDCATLAQSLGGGGHYHAAGAVIDELPWEDNTGMNVSYDLLELIY